jgi:hypothetical protein
MAQTWQQRRDRWVAIQGGSGNADYAQANEQAIDGVINNLGADPGSTAGGGVRVVFNMSNENIRKFCADSGAGRATAYKNSYDLGTAIAIGANPARSPKRRELVDQAIYLATGLPAQDIYFGAAEVNGSGVRFYGDYCLVLKDPRDEWVLDRNSYDIARPPLAPGPALDTQKMHDSVVWMSGRWGIDLGHMLVVKVFSSTQVTGRRLTVGQISNAVLNDEDYVEVLREGSFDTGDVAEVRTSATEAARESAIADRALHGPTPSAAELQWRGRRLEAEQALSARGLAVRVVTSAGRTR